MNPNLFPILFFAVGLSGCSSMSGLGGSSRYACEAPDGVSCESISGTYANAVAGNLPSQREKDAPPAQKTPSFGGVPTPATPGTEGAALRSQAHTLRLWMKPWVDIDGDLYSHAYIYVQVNHGKWLVDRIERPVRETHAPLRAPSARPPADGASARPPAFPQPPGSAPGGSK